jgi:hypothetical protein
VKRFLFFTAVFFTLYSCTLDPPELKVKADKQSVLPGESVVIDATASTTSKWTELKSCEFLVIDADGNEVVRKLTNKYGDSDISEFAIFKFNFTETGEYTVKISLSDIEGNISTSEYKLTVGSFFNDINSLDLNMEYASTDYSFSLESSLSENENVNSVKWELVNAEGKSVYSAETETFNVSSISEPGDYQVQLTLFDMYGNSKKVSSAFTIASIQPVVTGTPVMQELNRKPEWTWTIHPDAVKQRIKLNSNDPNGWQEITTDVSSFVPENDLEDGFYTLYVQACDSNGAWSESGSYQTKIDFTPPVIGFKDGWTTNDRIPFGNNHKPNITNVICSDNLEYISLDKITMEYISLPESKIEYDKNYPGVYKMKYTARDSAGNISEVERTITLLPPLPDISSAVLNHPDFPQNAVNEKYSYDGVVGNNINSFGGALKYEWSAVSGEHNYTDSSITTDNFEIFSLPVEEVKGTVKVKISYTDFPEISSEFSKELDFYPSIYIPNYDFESGSNVAPWKWDIDYEYEYSTLLSNHESRDDIQDTSENYEWYFDVCGITDDGYKPEGVISSKGAKLYDTSFVPSGTSRADIHGTTGMLYSPEVQLYSKYTYIVTADVFRGVNGSTVPTSIQVYSTDGLTVDGKNILFEYVPEGQGWFKVTYELTPDNDGKVKLRLFRGDFDSADPWDTFYFGEVVVDNFNISYK